MQVSITISSATGLFVFGTVIAGFIKKMQKIEKFQGSKLLIGRRSLQKFQNLKKGLGPYLLGIFSINTIAMAILVFLAVAIWSFYKDLLTLLFLIYAMIAGLELCYTVVMVEEAQSEFEKMLPYLRYSFTKTSRTKADLYSFNKPEVIHKVLEERSLINKCIDFL